MRIAMTWAAVAVILASAGSAAAQGRGGLGRFGGPALVINESVQTELKMTDEQKKKAEEFGSKFFDKMRELFQDSQGDFEKMQKEMVKANAAGMKEVGSFLKDDQTKRLKQISWQISGINALATDEELQKEIKLTGESKDKVKKLADELRQKTTELLQEGFSPDTQKKMQELRKDYGTKATDALNADQKKAYKETLGKSFEVKFPQPGQ
ncbi:MAG: hypothetical protein U0746_17300 [Gemmataceae bacterium]